MMTRDEHVAWCKRRAHEYLARGDLVQAMASMGSDLRKHPETANHPAIALGLQLQLAGLLSSRQAMKEFIDGFN